MSTMAAAAPFMPAGAASTNAPPFRLPGEHFTAALLFLVAGAFGLIAIAPGWIIWRAGCFMITAWPVK